MHRCLHTREFTVQLNDSHGDSHVQMSKLEGEKTLILRNFKDPIENSGTFKDTH